MSTAQVIWWHGDGGQRIALMVATGHKYVQLVSLDEGRGLRLFKVPKVEYDDKGREHLLRMRDVIHKDKPYPVALCVQHMVRWSKAWGISPAALHALRDAL